MRTIQQDAIDHWPTVYKALASKNLPIKELVVKTGLSRQKLGYFMNVYSELGMTKIVGHQIVKHMPQPIWGLR